MAPFGVAAVHTRVSPMKFAARLVNDMMLVSVLVAGEGAETAAAALTEAGATAEVLDPLAPMPASAPAFDLILLLARSGSVEEAATRELIARLCDAGDRLLFAPLPLAGDREAGGAASPALPELTRWFELFAELGFQPMVEFDAGFVAQGAFLVDRSATAAESELAAFADRLQQGEGAAEGQEGASSAHLAQGETEAPKSQGAPGLRARLAERDAELAELRARLAQSESACAALTARAAALTEEAAKARDDAAAMAASNAGWDGLRHWVRASVSDPGRDSREALAKALPLLNAWRAPALPPLILPPRRGRIGRLFARGAADTAALLLADTAMVRASPLFDAAWYVASIGGEAAGEAIDPVFHYVFVGGPGGADPGPWFDTAAYLARVADLVGSGVCPLVHAIRSGAAERMAVP